MPYATAQDLIERYGEAELIQLTDDSGSGVIDLDVLDRALADADAEINGYLSGRYALPLGTTPPLVRRLACEIARYMLYDDAAPEQVQRRYDAALKTLHGIGAGRIQLGLDEDGAATVSVGGGPEVAAPERVFTRDTLQDF